MEGIEFKTQSESIGKVTAALAAFQASVKGVKKTAENPFFHSKYAELSDVWDEIREPLSKNGLAVVQTFLGDSLVTTLAHTSGEWFRGYLKLTPIKANDPQAQGSAITYVRRYALQAITGIAPIDDDGNAASGKDTAPRRVPLPAPVRASEPTGETFGKPAVETESANLLTSRFSAPDMFTSKKNGKGYWATFDAEGSKLFIFDAAVASAISEKADQPLTVELERTEKGTRIVGVIQAQ